MTSARTMRFNRAASLIALLWIAIVPRLDPLHVGFDTVDFPQFYMGGAMVLRHAGGNLYPLPLPQSAHHPGLPGDSMMRPAYASLAESLGVAKDARFILSPLTAVLFTPMAALSFRTALIFWRTFVIASMFGIALLAARTFVLLSGRRSPWEGILILAVAISPRTWTAVRFGNVTPIEGLLLGWIPCGILLGRPLRSGATLTMGALFKYGALVFVPLVAALRRWSILISAAIFATILLVGSLLAIGTGPFVVFLRDILPTLNRPYLDLYNQSVWSCVPRWIGEEGVAVWVRPAIGGCAALLVVWICVMLFRCPLRCRRHPEVVLCAAAALIAWFLLFSPICWNSYQIYLMPFWGAFLWNALRSRRRSVTTALVLVVGSIPWLTIWLNVAGSPPPEPFASAGFWTDAGTFGIAAWWLSGAVRARSGRAPAIGNTIGTSAQASRAAATQAGAGAAVGGPR